jgi:hypothetical protein
MFTVFDILLVSVYDTHCLFAVLVTVWYSRITVFDNLKVTVFYICAAMDFKYGHFFCPLFVK